MDLSPAQEIPAPTRAPAGGPAPSPAPQPRETGAERLRRALAVRLAAIVTIALAGMNLAWLHLESLRAPWHTPLPGALAIAVGVYLLSRLLIAVFYRPPRDQWLRPTVTIVVTAHDEDASIDRALESCHAVDYPPRKLQVVVVHDGATEGSRAALEQAKARWPALRTIRLGRDRGRREAMAAGARVATGEILVYVDSAFLRADAIRAIVQGFADPRVAAVAGHTEVENAAANLLTRMQGVCHELGVRLFMAAESVFGAVSCCPGSFAAYRRSCVLEVLEEWLRQPGVRDTAGHDRSLTTLLLRHHRIIYSSEAVAATIVPERQRALLRQRLHRQRSWLRESLLAARFLWRKHPLAALSFYAELAFPVAAPLALLDAFLRVPLLAGSSEPLILHGFGILMIGCILSACHLFWKANGAWIYGAYYTVYWSLVLVWQTPYAMLTWTGHGWRTRRAARDGVHELPRHGDPKETR